MEKKKPLLLQTIDGIVHTMTGATIRSLPVMSLSRTTTSRFASRVFRQCIVAQRGYATSSEVVDSDVVIVGGGPAGLALASALGSPLIFVNTTPLAKSVLQGSSEVIQNQVKVTLVDGSDLSRIKGWNQPPTSFSNRVVSLTNASRSFLSGLPIHMPTYLVMDTHRFA